MTSLSFYGYLAYLEQSGGQIPDKESAKVMFSVRIIFCLTKTKNRARKYLNSFHTIALSKGTFLD